MFYFALDKQICVIYSYFRIPWFFLLGKNNFLWYSYRYIAHFDGNCNFFLSLSMNCSGLSFDAFHLYFFLCFQGIFISQFSSVAHSFVASFRIFELHSIYFVQHILKKNITFFNEFTRFKEQNRNILKKNKTSTLVTLFNLDEKPDRYLWLT